MVAHAPAKVEDGVFTVDNRNRRPLNVSSQKSLNKFVLLCDDEADTSGPDDKRVSR